MLGFDKRDKTNLDDAINVAYGTLLEYGPDDPKYPEILSHVERLMKLKADRRMRVSPDTLTMVAGNLLGILIIVSYEHAHVIVSKGLGFIRPPK